MKNTTLNRFGFQLIALALALGITSLILLAVGASPLQIFKDMFTGSLGSVKKFSDVLVSWVPLLPTALSRNPK